jgi:hypothetical protein
VLPTSLYFFSLLINILSSCSPILALSMQFKVRLPSGRVVIGSLVQIDFKYDLAVVKIRACTWFSGSSSQF